MREVRYKINGQCQSMYSKDGGITWYLDPQYKIKANPKHIYAAIK